MKKFLKYLSLFLCLCFFAFSPFTAFGEEITNENEYDSFLSNYDLSSFEYLDEETYDFLNEAGFLDFNYEKLINISFSDFKTILTDSVKKSVKTPFQSTLVILVFIILSALFNNLKSSVNDNESSSLYSTVSALVISIILCSELKNTVAVACTSISVCSDFMYAFAPAFCVIAACSGNAVSSLSTNAMLLFLAQVLNYISANIFIPLSNAFLALGICSGIRSELNLSGIITMLKKYITTAISVCSAAFVSVLSIKTAVASRADALGLRSVRFAINSVVPVIGSAISEGLLSIQSYSSLIKSGVGIVGIIAVGLVFLPSIIQVAFWRFFLNFSSVIAETFCDKSVSSVIKAFCDALLIMNVILILSMVTTIISLGILVATKGS